MVVTSWSIPGADGEAILGDTHEPAGAARGVALVAHGFKGYKDYGMFPRIAETLAGAGLIAHRFNFSHSGMTNDIATFARPDLFERDTWNRQVFDLRSVIEAINDGGRAGAGLPLLLFGHSRGGVSCLLTAGRGAGDALFANLAGVATAAAPSACDRMAPGDRERLLEEGWVESPSSRTGQSLRVGRAFLDEQLADPGGHDLPALVKRITCPLLVVHGDEDPTVPVEDARAIAAAAAAGADLVVVPGANHVFNTPNPMAADAAPSPQLAALLDALTGFARRVCGRW